MAGRATKAAAEKVLRAVAAEFGAEATGPEAHVRGVGPELVRDWDWCGTPNWAVLWEGGPAEWAIVAPSRVAVEGAFLEPYAGWALMIWRAE